MPFADLINSKKYYIIKPLAFPSARLSTNIEFDETKFPAYFQHLEDKVTGLILDKRPFKSSTGKLQDIWQCVEFKPGNYQIYSHRFPMSFLSLDQTPSGKIPTMFLYYNSDNEGSKDTRIFFEEVSFGVYTIFHINTENYLSVNPENLEVIFVDKLTNLGKWIFEEVDIGKPYGVFNPFTSVPLVNNVNNIIGTNSSSIGLYDNVGNTFLLRISSKSTKAVKIGTSDDNKESTSYFRFGGIKGVGYEILGGDNQTMVFSNCFYNKYSSYRYPYINGTSTIVGKEGSDSNNFLDRTFKYYTPIGGTEYIIPGAMRTISGKQTLSIMSSSKLTSNTNDILWEEAKNIKAFPFPSSDVLFVKFLETHP